MDVVSYIKHGVLLMPQEDPDSEPPYFMTGTVLMVPSIARQLWHFGRRMFLCVAVVLTVRASVFIPLAGSLEEGWRIANPGFEAGERFQSVDRTLRKVLLFPLKVSDALRTDDKRPNP